MSEPPRRYGWEDYLYPPNEAGIQVLRNKLGLTNYTEWFNAERMLVNVRSAELIAQPALVPRTFDADHWKAIHHQLFQDMYGWAGEFRTVNIGKAGHGFAPEAQLEEYASEILGRVREANMFAGRDRAGVVEGLMNTMQAVNIMHPFRYLHCRTRFPTRSRRGLRRPTRCVVDGLSCRPCRSRALGSSGSHRRMTAPSRGRCWTRRAAVALFRSRTSSPS